MCFLNRTAHVRRISNGLLATVLAFITILGRGQDAFAVVEQPTGYLNHDVGIVNATFGLRNNCSLYAWTASGTVTPGPSDWDDCVALLSVSRPTEKRAGMATSTLQQTFTVNPAKPTFKLFVKLASDNPNQSFEAQTFTIYDKAGNVIVNSAYNSTENKALVFDLSGYGGKVVTFKMATTVNTLVPASPTFVAMEVYFRMLYSGPDPEGPPGGGF